MDTGLSLGSDAPVSTPAPRKLQARPTDADAALTADHDEGLPPLYGAPLGFKVPVLIDGRWVVLPPGDPVAVHLVGAEVGGSHG